MRGHFENVRVSAVTATVPSASRDLTSMEGWDPMEMERILKQTGINRIRTAPRSRCAKLIRANPLRVALVLPR